MIILAIIQPFADLLFVLFWIFIIGSLVGKFISDVSTIFTKTDWSQYRKQDPNNIDSLIGQYEHAIQEDANAMVVKEIILKEFPMIRHWTAANRAKFIWRTMRIREQKHFHGQEGFEVIAEHEIIISATIAQLTFGLQYSYHLPTFELIEIYPRHFYSKLVDNHVEGLTLGNGRLFLSWHHFEEGHDDSADKKHLGFHEFAHAMMIEFDHFRNLPRWKKWQQVAHPVMQSIQRSDTHFFRKYGATNIHEFWAVTVETFFEQPQEFKQNYHELFDCTCKILNQRNNH